jgi:hypothetical protein
MNINDTMTSHLRAHICAALLAPFLLLAGLNAQAAVVEVLQSDWGNGKNADCCDASFKVNFDEIKADVKGGATVTHSYADAVPQNFTLSHSGTTGDLIFTIGGSAPITIDLPELTGWETIGLEATVGGDKNNTLVISNLLLTSGATGAYNFANALNLPAGSAKTQAIILTDDGVPNYFNNFTLTGTLVFDWDATAKKGPNKNDLEFKIGVAGETVVPVPAAVWLFVSALAGLGWFRRKPTA